MATSLRDDELIMQLSDLVEEPGLLLNKLSQAIDSEVEETLDQRSKLLQSELKEELARINGLVNVEAVHRERLEEKLNKTESSEKRFQTWTATIAAIMACIAAAGGFYGLSQLDALNAALTTVNQEVDNAKAQEAILWETSSIVRERTLLQLAESVRSQLHSLSTTMPRYRASAMRRVLNNELKVLADMRSNVSRIVSTLADTSDPEIQVRLDSTAGLSDDIVLLTEFTKGVLALTELSASDNPDTVDERCAAATKLWNGILRSDAEQKRRIERLGIRCDVLCPYALGTINCQRFYRLRGSETDRGLQNTLKHFETAIELAPEFGRAYGMCGFVLGRIHRRAIKHADFQTPAWVKERQNDLRRRNESYVDALARTTEPVARSVSYNNRATVLLETAQFEAKASAETSERQASIRSLLEAAYAECMNGQRIASSHPVVFLTAAQVLCTQAKLLPEQWGDEDLSQIRTQIILSIGTARAKGYRWKGGQITTWEGFQNEYQFLKWLGNESQFLADLKKAAGFSANSSEVY